jgi:hypothetical protein
VGGGRARTGVRDGDSFIHSVRYSVVVREINVCLPRPILVARVRLRFRPPERKKTASLMSSHAQWSWEVASQEKHSLRALISGIPASQREPTPRKLHDGLCPTRVTSHRDGAEREAERRVGVGSEVAPAR